MCNLHWYYRFWTELLLANQDRVIFLMYIIMIVSKGGNSVLYKDIQEKMKTKGKIYTLQMHIPNTHVKLNNKDTAFHC